MSIANWSPTAFYLIGDYVYDLSNTYYVAIADNHNDQPPSASWSLVVIPIGPTGTVGPTGPIGPAGTAANTGATGPIGPTGIGGATGSSGGIVPVSHGGFISTVNQPLIAATPRFMTYDTTTSAIGCNLVVGTGGGTSAIQVTNTGVYQITISVQWDKFGGGGTDNVQIWFTVNGVNVPWSNSEVDITQQINQVTAVDIILSLNAGDKLEVVGYTPLGTQVRALANPIDPTHPVAIPSIITDILRIA